MELAKESDFQRDERIKDSQNGATLKTKIVSSKKVYKRDKRVAIDEDL